MKYYSKEESRKLRLHTFATTTNNGVTIVRAFLKENAAAKLGVSISEVYSHDGIYNSVSCDEICEHVDFEGGKMVETYTIEMKK